MSTILIIDDDEAVRTSIARVLQRAGHTTLEAADGSAAVYQFAEHFETITAATLDLAMPVTDGRSALSLLRSAAPNLPIIVVSAYSEPEGLPGRGPGERGVGYLQKPFLSVELLAELNRVIEEAKQG